MTPRDSLYGLKIILSPLATNTKPVRTHKKRSNQTKAYHARVNKKWLKRFGTREAPGCWMAGNKVYMHPAVHAEMSRLDVLMEAENVYRKIQDAVLALIRSGAQAGGRITTLSQTVITNHFYAPERVVIQRSGE